MKKWLLVVLMLLPLTVSGLPSEESATLLSWTAPTENTDGTPLTDLAGYKIYWRQSTVEAYTDAKSITINDPAVLNYGILSMSLPSDGYYSTVITAFNALGNESEFSTEANFTIRNSLPYKFTGVGTVPAVPPSLIVQ
jgi:hypothetical protein